MGSYLCRNNVSLQYMSLTREFSSHVGPATLFAVIFFKYVQVPHESIPHPEDGLRTGISRRSRLGQRNIVTN